ncbi:hypothetical protein OROMI_020822 [Orobanche minor]
MVQISRGFGFPTMWSVEEPDRCIKYLDRYVLEGRIIMVEKRSNGALSIELTTNNPNMRIIHRKGALILGQWVSEIRDDTRKPGSDLNTIFDLVAHITEVIPYANRLVQYFHKAEWGPIRHIRVIKERRSGISRGFDFPSVGAAQTMMDRFVHEGLLVYDSKLFFEYRAEWGPIRHIRVIKERRSGISRGFAFVDFPYVGAAQTMMDRFVHEGLLVYDSKLFFEYRPSKIKYFINQAEWGPIRHIRVIKERRSGISRGFAFVDFPSVGAAQTMMDRFVHEGLLVYDSKLFFEYRGLRRSNILSTPLENIEEPLKFFLRVFAEWGPIRHIRVIKERRSGISHGFAFVDFPYVVRHKQ